MRLCRVAGLVVLAVAFAAIPARAQQDDRGGFIGLGIGPSKPLGRFGSASPTHSMGRGAGTGYTSTLVNVGYRFRRSLGLAAALAYSEYPVVEAGDDDWWQVASATVGPMYAFHLNPRTGLDLKAMLGFVVLTPVEDSYTTEHGVGSGFGIDLRASIRHDVLERWAVFGEVGVQSSSASLDSGVRFGYRALITGIGVAFRPNWGRLT